MPLVKSSGGASGMVGGGYLSMSATCRASQRAYKRFAVLDEASGGGGASAPRTHLCDAEPQAQEIWNDYEGVADDKAVHEPHDAIGDLILQQ